MGRREQPRKAPVGLRPGDIFETPDHLGDLEVLGVDREEDRYEMRAQDTGEEVEMGHDALTRIMSANVHYWE